MSRPWHHSYPDSGLSRSSDRFSDISPRHPRHPTSVSNGWHDDIEERRSDRGRGFYGGNPHPHNKESPRPASRWSKPPMTNPHYGNRRMPPPKADGPPKKPKSTLDIARKFAENTSLGGVTYMNNSNRWWSTFFWVIIFVVAMGLCTAHLYLIFKNYYGFPYSTIDELQYDFLPFPSVTVCNRNPIRVSGMEFVSSEMRAYLNGMAPSTTSGTGRRKRQVSNGPGSGSANRPGQFAISSSQSARFSDYETFLELYGNITRAGRRDAGHRKNVMIIDCSFNGYECYVDNFTHILSAEYGNCFTFNGAANSDDPYLSRQSGRTYGLRLELLAEIQEYPSGVTDTKGFSVSIHPFHTIPFPEVTGISVSPGYETSIGIKYTNVTKLGTPYNSCEDPNAYLGPFDSYYTQQTCQITCHYKKILDECGCYYAPFELYYASETFASSRNCYLDSDITCISVVEAAFKDGTYSCTCYPGCTETKYAFQYSTVAWPERSLVNSYTQKACQLSDKVCTEATNSTEDPLTVISENFGVLNIYFDELTFHNIYEVGTYDVFSLASDVGGTLGLWLGVSILTGVEVIQFITELIRNSCRGK